MKQEVTVGDRKITIIGTAHVSEESRKEVIETIESESPDLVCVELDEARLQALRGDDGWRELDVVEAIKDGKGYMLFLNLVLAIYQRKLGLEQGLKPGEELLSAVETAEENGIPFKVVDRDINQTFKRLFEEMTLFEKAKLFASLFAAGDEIEVEDLKEHNMLDALLAELEEDFPSVKRTFLDERNSYMAEKILEEDFNHAVAVVGAAHVKGLVEQLEQNSGYQELRAEKRIPWMTVLQYGLPAFIIAGLGYSFTQINFSTGLDMTAFWILSNGILAMLGAIISRASPVTWAASFLAAPLTSLDPALGAGMVAAYVEGKVRTPTVEELETITEVTRYRDLWGNQVGRILLTFFFVTMGSAAATFISAGYIASVLSGI